MGVSFVSEESNSIDNMLSHRVIVQFSFMMACFFTLAHSAVIVPFYGMASGELTADDASFESGEQLVRFPRYQPAFAAAEEEQLSAEDEVADLSVEASELLMEAPAAAYYPFELLVVPQQQGVIRVARHDGHGGAPGHTHTAAELAAIQQQQQGQQSQAAASSVNSAAKPVAVRVARHDGHGAAPGHTHTAVELAEIQKQQEAAVATAGVRPVTSVASSPTKQ